MSASRQSLAPKLEVGSRVVTGVAGTKKGEIKFIGDTQFSTGEWIGIALDTPEGKNDGSVAGVRYFECKPNHGLFLKRAQIRLDTSAASATDSKDRLAALREKRRVSTIPSGTIKPAARTTTGTSKVAATSKVPAGKEKAPTTKSDVVEKAAEPATESDADVAADDADDDGAAENDETICETDNNDEDNDKTPAVETTAVDTDFSREVSSAPTVTSAELDGLHEEIRSLSEQLSKVMASRDHDQHAFKTKESELLSQIGTLNQEAQELRNERDSAEKRLTEVLSNSGNDNAALTATLEELRELRERTDAELSKLRSELSSERNAVAETKPLLERTSQEVLAERDVASRLRCDLDRANHNLDKANQELSAQQSSTTKLRAELDKAMNDLVVEKSSAVKLRADLDKIAGELAGQKAAREEAERELEKVRSSTSATAHQSAKAAAEAESSANRIKELENQLNELMETCEMMTLDKEQLILDNELLQAQLDEAKLSAAPSPATVPAASDDRGEENVREENGKLREALRRLHQQASVDKTKLDELLAEKTKSDKELEALRAYRTRTEEELVELHQQVDASASFEGLIESLTEKNLELTQRTSELELTVRDMEEQQELSEELDQRQRHELDISRKQLDSANILVQEKEKIISALEAKIEEGKRVNEKFRRICEQLKAELDEMQGKVSLSTAESLRVQQRARAAAASQASFDEIQDRLQTLTQKLRLTQEAKNQLKALYSRQFALFGACSLHTAEFSALKHELFCVSAAAAGSSLCRSALDRCMQRFKPALQSLRDQSDSGEDASDAPTAGSSDAVSAAAIGQLLQLLRATCIAWQCSAAVLSGSSAVKDIDVVAISSAAANLRALFERATVSASEFVDGASDATGDDLRLGLDASLSADVEKVTGELEGLLSAHFKKLGVRSLSVADLQHEDHLELSDDALSLKRFYLACQSSYFAAGADITAAFIISKYSCTPDVTGGNSVADISRTLRAELEGVNVLSSGLILNVTSTALGAAYVRDTLGSCFISLDAKNLLHSCATAANGTNNSASVPLINPAQLRSSLAYVSQLRGSIAAKSSDSEASNAHTEDVRIINFTDSREVESLWALLSHSAGAPSSAAAAATTGLLSTVDREALASVAVPDDWQRFAVWNTRTRDLRSRLSAWEASYTEINALKTTIDSLQKELKVRQEELRAAKVANQELSTIAASAASSKATTGSSEEAEKLKNEIKVLTSALSVLEIQFENAEKENKRLRAGNRSGAISVTLADAASSGNGGPAASAALVQMLRIWRGVALHRLTSSLKPLPYAPEKLSSNRGRLGGSGVAATDAVDVSVPKNVVSAQMTALSTYREIRKMRASVRICSGQRHPGQLSVSLHPSGEPSSVPVLNSNASSSRRKDLALIEKYRSSLLACAAALG